MTDPRRRSPLEERAPIANDEASLRLEEVRFAGKLILRGAHQTVKPGVATVLGTDLPKTSPNSATGDAATALWLSPDEWMIVTEPESETVLAQELGKALDGVHHQIADVTDYYTILRLSGAEARTVLMKLTTLDIHARAFKSGEVRGTMLMHVQATLFQRRDDASAGGPAFDIFVRWSMADYLWCLIAECGREFGLPAQKPVTGERLVI